MGIKKYTEVLSDDETRTIPSALRWIYEQAKRYGLCNTLWSYIGPHISFLSKKLGLDRMQILFLAIMVEQEESMSWKDFANFFHCMRLDVMQYASVMDEFEKKGWIKVLSGLQTEFRLVDGVVEALSRDNVFVPEKMDGLELPVFIKKICKRTDNLLGMHRSVDTTKLENWFENMIKMNMHLPLCQAASEIYNKSEMCVFLLCVTDYARFAGHPDEGVSVGSLESFYSEEWDFEDTINDLVSGNSLLMRMGLLEHKCVCGMANNRVFVVSRKTKDELLAGFVPHKSKANQYRGNDLTLASSITKKALFYNAEDEKQIHRLTVLLGQKKLVEVQKRLQEQGMRKGFACLFYGGPGTGKTETVLQLARSTGRDIMVVDIAGLRDKYVGESENNIKGVFDRYRSLCKHSKVMPILFFNEADGILGKRTEIGGKNASVDKMDNAMQNIILQEIENLEGILIATTNLTCNLDDAFERRFIFKVEFHKPDVEAKAKIWKSMMKELSSDDARHLASEYDFSGGQIENIARKQTINYVLTGKNCSIDEIRQFCDQETIGMKGDSQSCRRVVGFAS